MDDMNIICASNDGYAFGYEVMLKSLSAHIRNRKIRVYYFFSELSEQVMAEMKKECETEDLSIEFVKLDAESLRGIPKIRYISKEASVRLLIHKFLPESVERALWLDGDIIVNGDLTEFYDQDMQDYAFAACKENSDENWIPEYVYEIGFPKGRAYCNSGVLLINLLRQRACVDETLLMKFFEDNAAVTMYPDQDALNILYQNELKVIDNKRYNKELLHLSRKAGDIGDSVILHFIGAEKPWHKGYHGIGFRQFWKYARKLEAGKKQYPPALLRCIRIRVSHDLWNLLYRCVPRRLWNFGKRVFTR